MKNRETSVDRRLRFHIRGAAPLLMHNIRLANPRDEFARQLKTFSSKKKKADSDLNAMSDIEWDGGIYIEGGKVVLPAENIEACLWEGAKKVKQGREMRGSCFVEQSPPLIYQGPKDLAKLRDSTAHRLIKMVGIGKARVPRTRPYFAIWEADVVVMFYSDTLNRAQVEEWMRYAQRIGIGDFRPKFGRFIVESCEDV